MAVDDSGFGVGAARFAAWLVGTPAACAAAAEIVRLAGGQVAGQSDWDAAAIMQAGPADVLVVEAENLDEGVLAALLPAVAEAGALTRRGVVVAFDPAHIDVVAASLLDPRVTLLCTPSLAERVAALALAGAVGGLPGYVREDETDRLRALNAEIARLVDLLARLVGGERGDDGVGDRRATFGVAPVKIGVGVGIDPADLRATIRARRMRAQFFDSRLIEDPAWDMLLDLFAAELEGVRVSVSSLCIAAAVAPTTALRWIGRMTAAGLLARQADDSDRRRAFLALTDRARGGMYGYVAAAHRAGLPVV